MKIVLGLSDSDIDTIRELKNVADASVRHLRRKESCNEGLTKWERRELNKWLQRQKIFNRIRTLTANEMAAMVPPPTQKTGRIAKAWEEVDAVLTGVIEDPRFSNCSHQRIKDILIKRIDDKFNFLNSSY